MALQPGDAGAAAGRSIDSCRETDKTLSSDFPEILPDLSSNSIPPPSQCLGAEHRQPPKDLPCLRLPFLGIEGYQGFYLSCDILQILRIGVRRQMAKEQLVGSLVGTGVGSE